MMKWSQVEERVRTKSLIHHPFFQAWSDGKLTTGDLGAFAKQYYAFENNFPRLLSRVHSRCEDAALRRRILKNLDDEDAGAENHRELWIDFSQALGLSRREVIEAPVLPETRQALETLSALSDHPNFAVGLAAMYAFESQIPELSALQLEGLRRFYGITDMKALRFFELHKQMEAWHSSEAKEMILSSGAAMEIVEAAADQACSALWCLADGVCKSRPTSACAA
jgi:pyrroloquinoline-quinone synthase